MGRRAKAGASAAALLLGAAAIAGAATIQQGGLRITVFSQLIPYKLPRTHPAPIAIFVAGHLSNAEGGIPPQLRRLRIEVNRHGLLQSRGLAVCHIAEVQPAGTDDATQPFQEVILPFVQRRMESVD